MSKNRRFTFRVLVVLFAVIFMSVFLGNHTATQNAQEQQAEKETFKKFETPDNITRLIRDTSKRFAIVRLNNESERDAVYKTGNVVEDYGSFVLTANDKSQKISNSDSELQKLETTINLPNGKFEPLTDESSQSVGLDSLKKDAFNKDFYIVQFGGIAKDEWLESFREVGAEVVQYVPHQAFIVYGDGEAISKIANHSRVRWAGKYTAEQKISPELNDFTARPENVTAMFDVAVFARADLAVVSSEFANTVNGQIRNQIKLPGNFFNILRVEIPIGELAKIAAMPDVFRIDPYTKPIVEDERAAQIVAGNFFNPTTLFSPGYDPLAQFGADGTNVTVAVVDDGVAIPGNGSFYISAENAVDGPLRGAKTGASGGHGHLNASIIAGSEPFGGLDPLGYNYGIGIAPKANIINIPFTKSGYTGNDAQAVDDTVTTAGPNGVTGYISNNSWGNGANGNSYDSYAAMYDGFVHDASSASSFDPLTLIFSAGNCGNAPVGFACSGQTGLTRPKVAKNIITVGNSENIRAEIGGTNANSADDLASSSSRGPAADGRIKPDITAPGTVVTGSRAGNGGGLDGGPIDANHYYSSGTSHSAPQVAGAAALFTNFWRKSRGGVNPSPAMIKAAIIGSAQEMNGVNAGSAIPNGNEGWGRINMKYMLNTGAAMKHIDQETVLSSVGENRKIEGTVADSTKPVRISLVWTDPPGIANPALVNNLDLTVTIGNDIYKGNVFGNGRSITGGSFDTLNNVENVFLPAGIPFGTPFKIEVTATALNGNGRYGNADNTDQTFALIAYNYSSCVYSVSPTTFQTVPVSGGNINVNVTTENFCSWTGTSSVNWVTVTPDTPVFGNGAVTLSVQPNTNGASRNGLVRVAGRDFNLQQQGSNCSYALNPTSVNVPNSGIGASSFSVTAQSGCAWTAVSNASWITVTSGNSGSGSGTITFSAQANSGIARIGTITVGGQTFTVNQESGCSYLLSATGANFGGTGGSGSVDVTGGTGCAWTALSNASWITVTSGSNGTGNGTVTFSVAANTGASGTGTITIAGQTFTVNQSAGCVYTLSPTSANISVGGGTSSFNINAGAGCAWTAVSNALWITITANGSGSGNGVISISVAANAGAARTGTITAGGQTFTVNQSGICAYSLSSTSISAPAGGISGSVTVTTSNGCAWTANSNASWITVTTGGGTGNGTVAFSAAANTGVARTGTMTIAGQTFTVNQAAGIVAPRRSQFDFDGDNKTDLSIFRPSVGEWWYLKSANVGNAAFQFGNSSDKLVPADFTGDGKTDIAFFRPSTGFWFIMRSEDNSFFSFPFGTNGDIPAPADYDGDGKADPAVFRPSSTTWFISLSSGGTTIQQFGVSGDVPVVADYDGDGKSDIAIYRPSNGQWWLNRSAAGAIAFQFGASTDKPVQGDYTGDGKADIAFFRPSTGEWFVLRSENSSYYSAPFGAVGDIASPGDYDADGKADFAVFRPSNNTWFVQRSGAETLIQTFGITGDKPVPSAFIP